MAQARVATELDRLPWLKDETKPTRVGGLNPLLLWGLVALLVIAGTSFWAGFNGPAEEAAPADEIAGPVATITLPEPSPPEAATRPETVPQAEPAQAPPPLALPRAEPVRVARAEPAKRRVTTHRSRPAAKKARKAPAVSVDRPHTAWESAGAAGQVVRVGTFGSIRNAKRGWVRIAHAYPITRLPAVVVGIASKRNGRTYYRLQIGTTSQAHSEVLCQRMRIIGQSCVVVGLKGKG